MAHMVQGQENMGSGGTWEGGEVLDGLHSGVRLLGFTEGGRPGPGAQLRPLNGHGVPVRRHPKGQLALPQAKDAPPAPTARMSDKDTGGKYLR